MPSSSLEIKGSTPPQALARSQFMRCSYRRASICMCWQPINNLVSCHFDQWELRLALITEWIRWRNFLCKVVSLASGLALCLTWRSFETGGQSTNADVPVNLMINDLICERCFSYEFYNPSIFDIQKLWSRYILDPLQNKHKTKQ